MRIDGTKADLRSLATAPQVRFLWVRDRATRIGAPGGKYTAVEAPIEASIENAAALDGWPANDREPIDADGILDVACLQEGTYRLTVEATGDVYLEDLTDIDPHPARLHRRLPEATGVTST